MNFHYTIGAKLQAILTSGVLKLTPEFGGLVEGERAIAWFSSNEKYEITATKLLVDAGTRQKRMATMSEMTNIAMTGGVFRFEYKGDDLIPWPNLIKEACIPPALAQQLEDRAFQIGASPMDWSGSLSPVPIDGMSIEFSPEFGLWIPVSMSDVRKIAGISASIPQGSCSRDGVTASMFEYKTA